MQTLERTVIFLVASNSDCGSPIEPNYAIRVSTVVDIHRDMFIFFRWDSTGQLVRRGLYRPISLRVLGLSEYSTVGNRPPAVRDPMNTGPEICPGLEYSASNRKVIPRIHYRPGERANRGPVLIKNTQHYSRLFRGRGEWRVGIITFRRCFWK